MARQAPVATWRYRIRYRFFLPLRRSGLGTGHDRIHRVHQHLHIRVSNSTTGRLRGPVRSRPGDRRRGRAPAHRLRSRRPGDRHDHVVGRTRRPHRGLLRLRGRSRRRPHHARGRGPNRCLAAPGGGCRAGRSHRLARRPLQPARRRRSLAVPLHRHRHRLRAPARAAPKEEGRSC
jgi:hypothetical protein